MDVNMLEEMATLYLKTNKLRLAKIVMFYAAKPLSKSNLPTGYGTSSIKLHLCTCVIECEAPLDHEMDFAKANFKRFGYDNLKIWTVRVTVSDEKRADSGASMHMTGSAMNLDIYKQAKEQKVQPQLL